MAARPAKRVRPTDFPPFGVTVDVVVFTVIEQELHVLLVERGEDPFAGAWALPGGFKRTNETLEEAARRELREETGVEAGRIDQFGAYGDPGRDPRQDVVTVAYLALTADIGALQAGTDARAARLVPVGDIESGAVPLAFDHRRIVLDGHERLCDGVELRGWATALVPPTFTLQQLRIAYEAVWGDKLDDPNFRRALVTTDQRAWGVEPTKRRAPRPPGATGAPAMLYRPTKGWGKGPLPLRRPR